MSVFRALPWFAWIPIVAIIFGCLNAMLASWMRHRERMAMIERGMHPDRPEPGPDPDGVPRDKGAFPEL